MILKAFVFNSVLRHQILFWLLVASLGQTYIKSSPKIAHPIGDLEITF